MRRRTIVLGMAGLAASSSLGSAQSWPARPITFIVGFAPGGSTDVVARLVGRRMSDRLGTPVVIDNRSGGSGIIGQTSVARAIPDGYTLLFGSGTMAVNANLRKNLPFDTINDFVAVSQLTNIPAILCVNDDFPAKSVAELISYVKAHPGVVNYGSAGSGTLQHVAGALFEKLIDGQMVHVAYKGGAPANIDLAAGRIQIVFGPVVELASYIQSGKVRVLGVSSPARSPVYPSVPPIADTVPNYEISTWHGVLAPKGLPPDIVARLQKELAEIIAEPDIKDRLLGLGLEPIGSSPGAFKDFIAKDIRRWGELVALAGIEPE